MCRRDGEAVETAAAEQGGARGGRKTVTALEHAAYRLQLREPGSPDNRLPMFGRLFQVCFTAFQPSLYLNSSSPPHLGLTVILDQEYMVDCYATVEEQRLNYIRFHQAELRAERYSGVQDAVSRNDATTSNIGRRIVLPSSHTGSPRYMVQAYKVVHATKDCCRMFKQGRSSCLTS